MIPGNSKQNVLDAINELEKRPDIYSAEPNRTLEMDATPGDPAYTGGQQWAINKIDLPQAWNIATGSYSLNVGVVDSGIDRMHNDLYYRVSYDLSWSFLANNREDAFNDVNGHGTRVAGVIGAEGDNDTGMAGTCWEIKLVSLKIVDTARDFSQDNAIRAVQYAEEKGIPILNFSLGKAVSLPSLKTAIRGYSGLFVCAAGNNNDNIDSGSYETYPAEYNDLSNLISVGASTSQDQRWSNGTGILDMGSNYGKSKVDLFAPGVNIYTCKAGGGYVTNSGTSFAAPYVAGVAALMLSANPHLSADQLKTKIMDNVEKVFDSNGNDVFAELCKSGGRLNAYYAVNSITHTHSYTYTSCDRYTHEKRCSCGRVAGREDHDLLQSASSIRCKKCDYSASAWTLN